MNAAVKNFAPGLMRRRIRGLAVAGACTLLTVQMTASSPARAGGAADSMLNCNFEDEIAVSGMSNEPGVYTFTSTGRGVLHCVGTFEGEVIAGPGWFEETAIGTGTCLEANGYIRLRGGLPTLGGEEIAVSGVLWAERVGTAGTATGYINGVFFTAPYSSQPSAERTPCGAEGAVVGTIRGQAWTVAGDENFTPPRPTSLSAKASGSRVRLRWQPGKDSGPVGTSGYRITRNDLVVAEVGPDVFTVVDEVPSSGPYRYEVAAISKTFESQHSEAVTVEARGRSQG